uniref:Uncharacterized protein n=1 Tax=Molossus molossus TaxID=27622 RepID=A0A7J8DC10_MOLMO|nr:hypothetical protein HJG59_009313 [Molossus molossus]
MSLGLGIPVCQVGWGGGRLYLTGLLRQWNVYTVLGPVQRVPSSAAAAGGGKACAAQMWYETAVVNVWKISLSARHSTSHQLPLSWPGKLNVTMIPDLSKRMLVLLQRCSVDVTSIYNRRL